MPDYVDVILLLGPNGAGKTTLGRLLQQHFVCTFISPEEFFLERYATDADYRAHREEAYQALEQAVQRSLDTRKTPVVLEEVGLSDLSYGVIARLQQRYRTYCVQLRVSEQTCQDRVAQRGVASNYPKSPEFVRSTHARFQSGADRYSFDRTLDNLSLSAAELMAEFKDLLPSR